MSVKPIREDTFPLRASAFHNFPVKAAIDRGNTLTKLVFALKDSPANADTIPLRCLTYLNENFVDALHAMKEQAQLPDQGKLHITGSIGRNLRDKIKEIIGLDTQLVDEFSTITNGVFSLVNYADPEDAFYPIPEYKKWDVEIKAFDNIELAEVRDSSDKFPALILHIGSGGGLWIVQKDGSAKIDNIIGFSGKCFIGLAHALVGTADYNEIIALAKKGGTYADTVFADLIGDDQNSAYGHFPCDLPIFPFGKASETTWDRSRCSREDLAASLLFAISWSCSGAIFPVLRKTGIRKVYLAGKFFRDEYVRSKMYEAIRVCSTDLKLETLVVKCDHGAIGAMLTDCAH